MFAEAVALLVDYGLLIAPGVIAFAVLFVAIPQREVGLRIAVLIGAFILMRDAMTPLGLWRPGADLAIGFIANGLVLAGLGLLSLLLVFGLCALPGLGPLIVWWRGRRAEGIAVGIGAGLVIAIPILALTGWSGFALTMPLWMTGMFILAFFGNALEEVLFRGLLQGHLEQNAPKVRAALASGLAFGAGHGFLAFTVTNAGWPILAFTLAEGLACAFVRLRYGTVPAILTHGTAIFLIATPILS